MSENNTCCSFLKKLSIFLNGFIAMSGVTLIGLGIYVKFKGPALTGHLELSPTNLLNVAHLCLVMGCSTVLLGFAGWYGTVKESVCVLLFYFLFMAVIVMSEIVIATVVLAFLPVELSEDVLVCGQKDTHRCVQKIAPGLVNITGGQFIATITREPDQEEGGRRRPSVNEAAQEETLEHNSMILKKNYRGYNEPDDYSMDWNLVMEKLKCCGTKNYTDFSGSSFERRTGYSYPRSCCKSIRATACNGHDVSPDVIYQEGCFPMLLKITKTQSFCLSWGSLGAAVVQLPGILATLLLFVQLG